MKLRLKDFINYIVVLTVFTGAITFSGIFSFAELRIEYILAILVLLLWIPFLKNVYFNKAFLFLFGAIIIFSLYNVYVGKDSIGFLMKQVVGIGLFSLVSYFLMRMNNYDVKKLFKVYLNIAFVVGLIGVIQELSYLLNFKFGYDFSYIIPNWRVSISQSGLLRVNSISSEPAGFCYSMMPAFFVSITSLLKSNFRFLTKWKSLIIISSFFLTFSTIGYVGIVFSLFLLMYNYRKIGYMFGGVILTFALLFFLWNHVGDFRLRISDSVDVLTGKISLETTNLSTFALFSNALVAYNSFKDNPVFGSGLGSHPISYDKHISRLIDIDKISGFLNEGDANSLFLRLLSETGLFGIIIFLYFLFKFRVLKKNDKTNYLWIISNAILVTLLIRLIRCGHYFLSGFFLFFWLYYFTWRSNKKTPTIGSEKALTDAALKTQDEN